MVTPRQVSTEEVGPSSAEDATPRFPAIWVADLTRRFGQVEALAGTNLEVELGQIHALLGPNGAGKTSLLRILTGLVDADDGHAYIMGEPVTPAGTARSIPFGFVPSGDRTFYMRISGLENLLFFARLHGESRTSATKRAAECLKAVGLEAAAKRPMGTYSHGMQKRLSVARALLMRPSVLLVDEATHDLDPEGAQRIRALVSAERDRGAAVLWTTQRVDEIRGFADEVTLLDQGKVRFNGTVAELMATVVTRRFLLTLYAADGGSSLQDVSTRALGERGMIAPHGAGGSGHYLLSLRDGEVLGEAIATLTSVGIQVLACREERSSIEEAFLELTGGRI